MIKPNDLPNRYTCRLLAGNPAARQAITGGYACDMLSWAMSRLKSGDLWLTILNSINVVAVAALADCAGVLLTDGVVMEPDVLARAAEKGVVVYSTPLPTFEAAVALDRLLQV